MELAKFVINGKGLISYPLLVYGILQCDAICNNYCLVSVCVFIQPSAITFVYCMYEGQTSSSTCLPRAAIPISKVITRGLEKLSAALSVQCVEFLLYMYRFAVHRTCHVSFVELLRITPQRQTLLSEQSPI